jgi:hypothetical protein
MPTTTSSRILIRRLEFSDFAFVRGLASEQPNFTIPPPYVLWLLLKVHKNVCLVAEDDRIGPVGYLLAIPVHPPGSLYVWQLAASDKGKRVNAIRQLLQELRRISLQARTRRMMFSTLPKSPTFRAIQRYAAILFGARLEVNGAVPSMIAPGESEYRVELLQPKRQARKITRRLEH